MALYDQLVDQLKSIDEQTTPADFVRQFLQAYKFPRATIARLNIKDVFTPDTGISVSNKVIFVFTESENLYTKFDHIQRVVIKNQKYRFILLFNRLSILALDTDTNDWLHTSKKELSQKYEFFFPLMGIDKISVSEQDNVSVKIGKTFAQLYNEILLLNPGKEQHINKLFINLVACFLSDSLGFIDNLSI